MNTNSIILTVLVILVCIISIIIAVIFLIPDNSKPDSKPNDSAIINSLGTQIDGVYSQFPTTSSNSVMMVNNAVGGPKLLVKLQAFPNFTPESIDSLYTLQVNNITYNLTYKGIISSPEAYLIS